MVLRMEQEEKKGGANLGAAVPSAARALAADCLGAQAAHVRAIKALIP